MSTPRRQGAVLLDRSGGRAWATPAGASILDLDSWELTVIVDRPPRRRTPAGVRVIEIGDFTEERVWDAVQGAAASGPVDRISTSSEFFLETFAALREDLGIPGKGVDYTRRVRDKWSMKEQARAVHLRTADGVLACDVAQWIDGREAPGYVVKPRSGSGALGVAVANDQASVIALVSRLSDATAFLVEEFNPSPMLHVDGVVLRSKPLIQVSRYVRPCHVSGGEVPLSSHTIADEEIVDRVTAFVHELLERWPIDDDVFHCEIFDGAAGPALCEVAGRPGGAGVVDVFRATHGVDLRHTKTFLDLGLSVPPPSPPRAPHGGWTVIYASGPGVAHIDDAGLVGHATRDMLAPDEPRVEGMAGVGIATYTFIGATEAEIRSLIDRYEQGARCEQEPDVQRA